MSTFFFRAVATDGRLRTGSLTAETERAVAQELRKQGLTPIYVGAEQKKSLQLKLPAGLAAVQDATRIHHEPGENP